MLSVKTSGFTVSSIWKYQGSQWVLSKIQECLCKWYLEIKDRLRKWYPKIRRCFCEWYLRTHGSLSKWHMKGSQCYIWHLYPVACEDVGIRDSKNFYCNDNESNTNKHSDTGWLRGGGGSNADDELRRCDSRCLFTLPQTTAHFLAARGISSTFLFCYYQYYQTLNGRACRFSFFLSFFGNFCKHSFGNLRAE